MVQTLAVGLCPSKDRWELEANVCMCEREKRVGEAYLYV